MELTRHPLSMMRALKPALWASMAQAMPVGPAPTTRTSAQESGRDCDCVRDKVSGICSVGKASGLYRAGWKPTILAPGVPARRADSLLFDANGDAVANGQDGRKQILRCANQFVEFEDCFGSVVGVRPAELALPENVIRNKKAAAPQPRKRQAKDAWIVGLIHVVEDDVVSFLLLRKNFERVADTNRDALADAGTIEVAARLLGVLVIAVGVDDA